MTRLSELKRYLTLLKEYYNSQQVMWSGELEMLGTRFRSIFKEKNQTSGTRLFTKMLKKNNRNGGW